MNAQTLCDTFKMAVEFLDVGVQLEREKWLWLPARSSGKVIRQITMADAAMLEVLEREEEEGIEFDWTWWDTPEEEVAA
jgi:hypothetical protein